MTNRLSVTQMDATIKDLEIENTVLKRELAALRQRCEAMDGVVMIAEEVFNGWNRGGRCPFMDLKEALDKLAALTPPAKGEKEK